MLDQISESKELLFITKKGSAYLMILSPNFYNEITKELNNYESALERESELHDLASKVNKSRGSIKGGKILF